MTRPTHRPSEFPRVANRAFRRGRRLIARPSQVPSVPMRPSADSRGDELDAQADAWLEESLGAEPSRPSALPSSRYSRPPAPKNWSVRSSVRSHASTAPPSGASLEEMSAWMSRGPESRPKEEGLAPEAAPQLRAGPAPAPLPSTPNLRALREAETMRPRAQEAADAVPTQAASADDGDLPASDYGLEAAIPLEEEGSDATHVNGGSEEGSDASNNDALALDSTPEAEAESDDLVADFAASLAERAEAARKEAAAEDPNALTLESEPGFADQLPSPSSPIDVVDADDAAGGETALVLRDQADPLFDEGSLIPVVQDELEDDDDDYVVDPGFAMRQARLRRGVGVVVGIVAAAAVGLFVSAAVKGDATFSKASDLGASVAPVVAAAAAPETKTPSPAEQAPVADPTPPASSTPLSAADGGWEEVRTATLDALNNRELEQAEVNARQLISLQPEDAFGYLCLGSAQQDMGKIADARETYSNCVTDAKKGNIGECAALGGTRRQPK